jgi:hypothetical protein
MERMSAGASTLLSNTKRGGEFQIVVPSDVGNVIGWEERAEASGLRVNKVNGVHVKNDRARRIDRREIPLCASQPFVRKTNGKKKRWLAPLGMTGEAVGQGGVLSGLAADTDGGEA